MLENVKFTFCSQAEDVLSKALTSSPYFKADRANTTLKIDSVEKSMPDIITKTEDSDNRASAR